MNKRNRATAICLVPAIFISALCWAAEPITVTVSILPQKYFVEKIAGDAVTVSAMVAPGSNPAVYEPRPSQMNALAHSRIYFAIGVPFERVWLKKMAALNPKMEIVHTDRSIESHPLVLSLVSAFALLCEMTLSLFRALRGRARLHRHQ